MTRASERFLTVPPGVEINQGLSEDSDSVRTIVPTRLKVIGEKANGAVPVHIIDDGKEIDETFFFHQPEEGQKDR